MCMSNWGVHDMDMICSGVHQRCPELCVLPSSRAEPGTQCSCERRRGHRLAGSLVSTVNIALLDLWCQQWTLPHSTLVSTVNIAMLDLWYQQWTLLHSTAGVNSEDRHTGPLISTVNMLHSTAGVNSEHRHAWHFVSHLEWWTASPVSEQCAFRSF